MGLRGVASLVVLGVHYLVMPTSAEPGSLLAMLRRIGMFGSTGVDLFFVLSGFLLAGILLDAKDSIQYFRTFYVRRICRILPLYFCVLASFFVVRLFWSGERGVVDGPVPAWTYAVFVQNYYMGIVGSMQPIWLAVTWSLAIEEHFYAILPLTIRRLNRTHLTIAAVTLFFFAPLLRVALLLSGAVPPHAVAVWSVCRTDALAAGILAAVAIRTPSVSRRIISLGTMSPVIVLSCVGISGLVFQLCSGPSSLFAIYGVMHSLVAASYAVTVLFIAVAQDSWLSKLMQTAALMHAGRLCYSTYLLHLIVIYTVFCGLFGTVPRMVDEYSALVVVACIAITFAIAQLSWVFVEKPFIGLGQRFQY
jgi:peptidoglycan/LPS O-acetylase OafA/YrhL